MRKKVTARVVCLVIASIVLTGVLTVSAMNGSPYVVFRNALFHALANENATVVAEITIRVNGEVHEIEKVHYIQGYGRFLQFHHEYGMPSDFSFDADYFTLSTVHIGGEVSEWYSAQTHRQGSRSFNDSFAIFAVEGLGPAQIRFIELLTDLVVGDLKNNIIMSSQAEGTRRVSGAIVGSQIPEIIRAFIDVSIEEDLRWHTNNRGIGSRESYTNVLDIPMTSFSIDSVRGHADVDSNGNLLYLNAGAVVTIVNIFDETHLVDVEGIIRFSDVGKSNPQSPVPSAEELFTHEFMESRFGSQHMTVYFKRDADGNIDYDSITTKWPGAPLPVIVPERQEDYWEDPYLLEMYNLLLALEELQEWGIDIVDFLETGEIYSLLFVLEELEEWGIDIFDLLETGMDIYDILYAWWTSDQNFGELFGSISIQQEE